MELNFPCVPINTPLYALQQGTQRVPWCGTKSLKYELVSPVLTGVFKTPAEPETSILGALLFFLDGSSLELQKKQYGSSSQQNGIDYCL